MREWFHAEELGLEEEQGLGGDWEERISVGRNG